MNYQAPIGPKVTSKCFRNCAFLLLLCSFSALFSSELKAQWTFLGPQWIAQEEVKSHSIAVDHSWQIHCAFGSDSQSVEVRRYDAGTWTHVGAGSLPPGPASEVVLEFDHLGAGCLAMGPDLAMYKLGLAGWQWQAGLPNAQDVRNLQLKSAYHGMLWLSWVESNPLDTTHIWSYHASNGWQEEGKLSGAVIDLELDDHGAPVLLFEESSYLRSFNGLVWDSLPALPQTGGDYLRIATAADGSGLSIYALHRDSLANLSLDHFKNGQWLQFGSTTFALGDEADLVLSLDGVPHVACVQNSIGGLPEVWKLDGNTWANVGGTSAYNNSVSKPLLAFDTSAVFLGFLDEEKDFRNSMMVLGGPLSNTETLEDVEVQLFPNPAVNEIEVRVAQIQKGGHLRIVDLMGRQWNAFALSSGRAWRIDVSKLPSGSYFMVLEGKQGSRRVGKFIKIGAVER